MEQNLVALIILLALVKVVNSKMSAYGIDDYRFAAGQLAMETLKVAKQYLNEFGKLAKQNNTMIVPAHLSDLSTMVATAMATYGPVKAEGGAGAVSRVHDRG